MERRLSTILFIVFIICICRVGGFAQHTAFNRLTIEQGLSDNAVLAIAQDGDGFMWLGTKNGLNRFDGIRFLVYRNDPADSTSLINNNIIALYLDRRKQLWLGTSGGLERYDRRRDAFEHIRLRPEGVNNVYCVQEDREGNLWAGSSNGLFLLHRGNPDSISAFHSQGRDGIASELVRCVYEDRAGNIWVGTNDGLTRMYKENGRYRSVSYHHDPADPASLSADFISTIMEDTEGRIWIGTLHNGVNRYDPATGRFFRLPTGQGHPFGIVNLNVRKIIRDRSGRMWVGTQDGLSVVNPATGVSQSYQHSASNDKSLSQNSIYSVFEDANGSIWAGTYFGGANVVYSYNTSFQVIQSNDLNSSISNNVVSAIAQDASCNYWIGTEGGGLNYYHRTTGRWEVFRNDPGNPNSLASNLVKSVSLDGDGNIWVGTHGGGLNVLDPHTRRFKRHLYKEDDPAFSTAEIIAVREDAQGRLWVVSSGALRVFRRTGTDLEPLDLAAFTGGRRNFSVRTLHRDHEGKIWMGGYGGLLLAEGDRLQVLDSTMSVNCLLRDRSGVLWAGLPNGGLARYDGHRLVRLGEKEGLRGDLNVLSISDDAEGRLWLGTDNGIVKFSPREQRYQTYTVSDGLAGNECNINASLRDCSGHLYFGGFNGITWFDPANIETNRYVASVMFTGLRLFGTPVRAGVEGSLLRESLAASRELTFRHDQNVFTLEFALLNFIKSGKNKYRYQLEGFDKDWNESTVPSATYTNLPSGTYRFIVKGANNDGIWSAPATMVIHILPPLWLTWWAYCIYAVLLVAVVFLITRFFFLRELLKKEDELHQVKLNFFTNVSHEIRTHLTLIMTPIDKLLHARQTDEHARLQLGQVKHNAGRLLKLVSELMDFRKAETQHLKLEVREQELIVFLQDIYESFTELSLSKQIKLSFTHDRERVPLYFDKEQLEKVFFNLLANAFKFTPEGGRIRLSVQDEGMFVRVAVEDNGRGIAPEYIGKMFTNFFQVADHGLQNTGYGIGLALSRTIVDLHHGAISAESTPPAEGREGRTVFTVLLRKGLAHFTEAELAGRKPVQSSGAEPARSETPIAAEAPANTAGAQTPTLKQYTLQIVEDNPELRALIRDTFEGQYHILEADNGNAGWETASSQLPDIIVSDVMMPGQDGFALTRQLKTDPRTSHIPVILLTARSAQTDQVTGLETGADVYVTKPFSARILELHVRNLLAARDRIREKFAREIAQPAPPAKEAYVNTVDQDFLERVMALVDERMDDPAFGVDMLSRKLAMSPPVLYKKIKAVSGLSVNDFVKSLRLKKASQLLLQGGMTIYEVAYAVGYTNRKYFSQEFKKTYGKTPREFAGLREEQEED
ncbi:two-component regulator propeller domain-containing protein [Chitinophaga lutea]